MVRPLTLVTVILLTVLCPLTSIKAADDGQCVVLVTWDGFRWQEFFGGAEEAFIAKDAGVDDPKALRERFWREMPQERREVLLPFVWNTIARQGQIFGDSSNGSTARLTNTHRFSYPGYSEMFVGFADDESIFSNVKRPNPHVSVFEFLNRQPKFAGRVASIATWDRFPSILNQERSGIYVHSASGPIPGDDLTDRERLLNELIADTVVLWPGNQIDSLTIAAAREYLIRKQPRVLHIGMGETDEWGHARRYDRYLHAAHRADANLARLWELLQSLPTYRDRTSLIVVADHGRGSTIRDWTDHGAKVEGAEDVWMALLGPTIPPLGVRANTHVTLSQIAATISALSGHEAEFASFSPRSSAPLSTSEGSPLQ